MLWLQSPPKPRLPWCNYEDGSVTNVGDCYLRVERVVVQEDAVPPFYHVDVCDYEVTAWRASRDRSVLHSGSAVECGGPATLEEAKGWAERGLLALALDCFAKDWRGWCYVLAVLAGHVPCPVPAATLRARRALVEPPGGEKERES